jgi:hypothetical protein
MYFQAETPGPVNLTVAMNKKDSSTRVIDISQSAATNAMIEMGVRTGLSLLFSMLRLNWSQNSGK